VEIFEEFLKAELALQERAVFQAYLLPEVAVGG